MGVISVGQLDGDYKNGLIAEELAWLKENVGIAGLNTAEKRKHYRRYIELGGDPNELNLGVRDATISPRHEQND